MPRDQQACLADVVDSCDAIKTATRNLDFKKYLENPLVRSSVEREFIIIGEAMSALARIAPETFRAMTSSRRIVDLQNQWTHESSKVDDALVWAIVENDVAVLRRESAELIDLLSSADEDDRLPEV